MEAIKFIYKIDYSLRTWIS